MITHYKTAKERRQARTRRTLKAVSDRPRLTVFRSLKYVYAQVIDDQKGITLAAASSKDAKQVGELIAHKALKAKNTALAFYPSKYKQHL